MAAGLSFPPGARVLHRLHVSVAASALLAACLSPAYINRGDGQDLEQPKGDIGAILMDPVTYAVREAFFEAPPRCIAVMPFSSVWDVETNAQAFNGEQVGLVRRAFYAALAPSARLDVELERVDDVLAGQHPSHGDPYRRAALLLGCDSYLVGQVIAYRKSFYGVYSRVEVGARVRVLRTGDGTELWQARHVAESHGGGLILSPFSVVTEILDASSNAREEQIHRVTSDLARRLVATIPGFDGEPPPSLRIASGPATAAPAATVVKANRVNVRSGPGKDFPVMSQMARGTAVTTISDPLADGWTRVRLADGRTGYVASPYLNGRRETERPRPDAAAPPRPAPVMPVIGTPVQDRPAAKNPDPTATDEMGTLF